MILRVNHPLDLTRRLSVSRNLLTRNARPPEQSSSPEYRGARRPTVLAPMKINYIKLQPPLFSVVELDYPL
jgi:hypothetical protein